MTMAHLAKFFATAVLAAVTVAGANAATPSYRLVDLGSWSDDISLDATGINNQGQVIGNWSNGRGTVGAFSWQPGSGLTNLGAPQGAEGVGTNNINDSGTAAVNVYYRDPVTGMGTAQGYTLNQGSGFQALSNNTPSTAWAINNAGQVAGSKTIDGKDQAVIWTNGSHAVLPGLSSDDQGSVAWNLNDSGEAVGMVFGATGAQTVIWRQGQVSPVLGPPDAQNTGLVDINEAGQSVGYISTGYLNVEPARLPRGSTQLEFMDLGGPIQTYLATAINDAGVIVGHRAYLFDPADNTFYWSAETGGVPMTQLIDASTLPQAEFQLRQLHDINNHGQIVGSALIGGRFRAVLLDPIAPAVPEPSSLAQLLVGLTLASAFGAGVRRWSPREATQPRES